LQCRASPSLEATLLALLLTLVVGLVH